MDGLKVMDLSICKKARQGLSVLTVEHGSYFKPSLKHQLTGCAILLVLIMVMETCSSLDLKVQARLFNFESASWFLSPAKHRSLRLYFYDGPKTIISLIGVSALTSFIWSFKSNKKDIRRKSLTLFLAIVMVPLLVAGGKQYSNIYCPKELTIFGGHAPYQRILSIYENINLGLSKGKCFPAGHATGGFALMALFFCSKKKRRQVAGLITGLAAGWIMGLYQMLRGEHFLSHTLASMPASWIVIIITAKLAEALVTVDCPVEAP